MKRLLAAFCVLTAWAGASLGRAAAGEARAPVTLTLANAPSPLAADRPSVLVFWRSDCGPCLLEMADLVALQAAARPARVVPVGLQPPASLRPALARLHLADADSAWTRDDPTRLLVDLGGAPARLPLAVAFRADGTMCARHAGLLGRDRVHAWGRTCGGAHAAR